MAIWQFSVAFVPNGAPAPVVSEDGYDVGYLSEADTIRALQSLTSQFGTPRAALPDWQQFGLENGNRVDLSYEKESAELSARIDARDPVQMLAYVCSLARDLRCQLYLPESRSVIVPDVIQLQAALSGSQASHFVANPRRFLEELRSAG